MFLTYLSYFEKKLRFSILEILLLLFIFSIFDPLVSFTIYFCFFHTYKHLSHLIKNIYIHLLNKKIVIVSTFLFTLISWIGGVLIIYYLMKYFDAYESFLKVTFIGLAALTLPHMLLVDILYRKKFS